MDGCNRSPNPLQSTKKGERKTFYALNHKIVPEKREKTEIAYSTGNYVFEM